MGLFNLLSGNNSNNNSDSNNGDQPVVIQLNAESATVPANAINGRSIAQLFADYLGADVSRINTFYSAGRVTNGNDQPAAGTVYRANLSSETKG